MLTKTFSDRRPFVRRIIIIALAAMIVVASLSSAQETTGDPDRQSSADAAKPQSGNTEAALELENEKLRQEIANLSIENEALGVGTRKFSAIVGAIGGVTGALLTFFVGFAGLKLKSVQDNRLRQEKDLEQKKLDQDRVLNREKQTLEIFRDLGSENPRTQIAAASLLLQRLKSHETGGDQSEVQELERPTIIKVLVSVLKEKREPKAGATADTTAADAQNFETLRKYIADNLLELLRDEISDYDWQNVNLSKVWWKGVDASGVDFYQANLREAGFREANFKDAVFYQADLSKAVLKGAKLSGANFFDATIDKANMQGATYDEKTIWPDGLNYRETSLDIEATGARLIN